ncbi:hypothetical protein [Paenibacillus sp. FSL R10-2771]|uniref:hypothetical protein n=1 Tax=Paenibacillus sp. FSL R10-2771 TaxID=2954693 RepID=UPI0030F7EFF8
MNMSLNTEDALINIPYREYETGEELVTQCHRDNLLWAVIYKMRHEHNQTVLRDKLDLTREERLVLEHEDVLVKIRDKIDYLFIHHVAGMGYFQMTPERHRYKQLKLLLKMEEPNRIPLLAPQICKGCSSIIPAGKRALRVRDGNKNAVCCGYNCYGLMLAAGAAKQDHGS